MVYFLFLAIYISVHWLCQHHEFFNPVITNICYLDMGSSCFTIIANNPHVKFNMFPYFYFIIPAFA